MRNQFQLSYEQLNVSATADTCVHAHATRLWCSNCTWSLIKNTGKELSLFCVIIQTNKVHTYIWGTKEA